MDGDFKGDFTRDTFDLTRHFSRVLMQQGRVQLDADWNEQTDILLNYLRNLAADIIGKHGGPDDSFKITELHLDQKEKFSIHPGNYYVDGILIENSGRGENNPYTYQNQPFYNWYEQEPPLKMADCPALVYVDVWERHVTYLEDSSIREVALGTNSPDTATRAEVVWQVKVIEQNLLVNNEDLKTQVDALIGIAKEAGSEQLSDELQAKFDNWLDKITKTLADMQSSNKQPYLRARTWAGATDNTDACITPPDARFRGNENRLYRVEIHQGGKKENATFKWSRENGSVVFPIMPSSGTDVYLENLGRDDSSTLHVGDWVEIVDDDYVLKTNGAFVEDVTIYPLLQVSVVDQINGKVTVSNSPGLKIDPSKHSLLRRWDQKEMKKSEKDMELKFIDGAICIKEVTQGQLKLQDQQEYWLPLDEGIYIQFQPDGVYHSGDYWLIPARVITGDVEWPKDDDGKYSSLEPKGVSHHYAPLAIIDQDGKLIDLRYTFEQIGKPAGP
jgi:hypothetical protein